MTEHDVELATRAWGAMVATVQRITREAEAATADAPVTATQFQLLRTLLAHGEARQTDLAARTGTTAANVSQLVGRLEEAGLVRREAHGRSNLVHLTSDGGDAVEGLVPEYESFIASRFERLSPDELHALVATLEALAGPPD